jgi:hypothetical protein
MGRRRLRRGDGWGFGLSVDVVFENIGVEGVELELIEATQY